MSKLQLTLISDTHTKHKQITDDIIGGDMIIHAGDISSIGNIEEIRNFLKWYDSLQYSHKIFIAGNHDYGFETHIRDDSVMKLLDEFPNITYLMDSGIEIEGMKIYGSPWQPRFFDWAFNVDRNSEELNSKWEMIPDDIDILITHGPASGFVDRVKFRHEHLGCELLVKHIKDRVKPILHVCGHIHTGRGVIESDGTVFVNASVLNERYNYEYKPINLTIDTETKEITFNN